MRLGELFKGQRLLALICLGSLAAVGAALVAQHLFDVKPCPWCVLQRLVFLLIAAVAGLGWLAGRIRAAQVAAFGLIALLALGGVAAAYYQHEVASQMASCAMTFADRVLTELSLESAVPALFMVTASCSEASQYRLLGLPYEIWSGLLYALTLLLSVLALRNKR
ncbi:disulfide bond formation protein B [Roseateles toxinivorans]|uniref:Thiol:disulfide interchange protein DsbB n=1 Tax=Roseateles toxinivorans TaxID=270368 RepID=A0A4R6QJZ5_9BURK|nr:disulfide bond formation protein B [Roseateles toxinivorans]TDP64056.1 thiol:disulfide interchange protein DsbB [Roseateles toxinivorans]